MIPWQTFETHRGSAFLLAGSSLIASVVVPVGISVLTDWAWASGLLLVGFAVMALAIGLLGLYPQTSEPAPGAASGGAIFAGIAGTAALSLFATTGVVLVGELGLGTSLPRPTGVFVAVALAMAGGSSLGLLSFGFAVRRTTTSRTVGHLLAGGGLLLLLPVAVESLGLVSDVTTPPWVLFPVIGLVAIDMLVIGYTLRQGAHERDEVNG